ncbi:MAG: SUMF1/EgtB/PvdO family nonheme iron enzyme [Bacteroidales bacterium]|nr:SUMF1/EgtB/PvdO family nonheme iron enzyme [Bacteroidales bacterium]
MARLSLRQLLKRFSLLFCLMLSLKAMAYIIVTPQTVRFNGAGDVKQVRVSHSGGWNFGLPVEEWIFCSQDANVLSIECYKNFDDTTRTAHLTLSSGTSTTVITIVQEPYRPPLASTAETEEEQSKTKHNREFEVGGAKFTMIYVEGGRFTMGATYSMSSDAFETESPAHTVELSDFYLAECEVTQALWVAVMGSNPSIMKGDNLPVDNISWFDCWEFIRKLNRLTGEQFLLPTEAQWEYAARGGKNRSTSVFPGGSHPSQVAWTFGNAAGKLHRVKTLKPNLLGFYDMSGNVWEWCNDYFDWYPSKMQINPTGPESGSYRVMRGGAADELERRCRVTCRSGAQPGNKTSHLGLRLAMKCDK